MERKMIKAYDTPIEDDNVLADRIYNMTDTGGQRKVRVRIGIPILAGIGPYYICKVEIDDGATRFKAFGGEDPLEALLASLTYVGTELCVCGGCDPSQLMWEGRREERSANFPFTHENLV